MLNPADHNHNHTQEARPTMLKAILPDQLSHGWQVAATVLAIGAVFTAAWGLSQAGMLELAATGIAFFAVTLFRLLGPTLIGGTVPEFAGSAQLVAQLRGDFNDWIASRKLLSVVLIAGAYTLGFLIVRLVTSALLTAIASPWIALAIGLFVAAAVVSPTLVRAIGQTITARTNTNEVTR